MARAKKFPAKPYSPAWEREANQMARDYAPTIHACTTCGGPVIRGYCCTHCGSNTPNERAERKGGE